MDRERSHNNTIKYIKMCIYHDTNLGSNNQTQLQEQPEGADNCFQHK